MQGIYLIHLLIYIKMGISSSVLLEIHYIFQDYWMKLLINFNELAGLHHLFSFVHHSIS